MTFSLDTTLKRVSGIIVLLVLIGSSIGSTILSVNNAIRQGKVDTLIESKQLFFPLADGRSLEQKVTGLKAEVKKAHKENREDHIMLLKAVNGLNAGQQVLLERTKK